MTTLSSSTHERIGRYELVRELGSGAMGTVYAARDTVLGRPVALKTFRAGTGITPSELTRLRRRLLREAQTAGLAVHPNVVTVFDVVDDGDRGFYIAMELVEGTNLQAHLGAEKALPLEEALDLGGQIAWALDHLHQRGVIHLDLKPSNILVTPAGRIKLTDFGIARGGEPSETQETQVFGTPQYMSPEQVQGRAANPRTDVFALGILLYEMLTGGKPFQGRTVAEVTHSILYDAPAPMERDGSPLPDAIVEPVMRALAKDPEQRFASAGELAAALATAAGAVRRQALDTAATAALPQPSRRPGDPVARLARTPLKGWLPVALSGLLAAAGVTALSLAWDQHRADSQPPREEPELELAYLRLLGEGQRLMTQGDPEAAAVLFTAAQGFSRDPATAYRLRDEALRLVEEKGVQLELETARKALAEGRYEEVIAATRSLLTTQAGHAEALRVLAEVESALARPPPPAEPVRLGEAPGWRSQELPPGPRPALLELDVDALAPRGVVTLFADSQRLFSESYDFYQRRAWFWKQRHPGKLSREIEIPPDTSVLRILVARPGEAARMLTHEVSLVAGSRALLELTIPLEGEPQSDLY